MTESNEEVQRHGSPVHRRAGRVFPFLTWLRNYRASDFRGDLAAGLTVAVVLIPQSMAYAMLAGLPAVYGLYAAAVTPWIASLWGSLRQLSTGPIAVMSLLVLTTLSPFAVPGSPEFIELALLLSFMVGIFYLAIGLFRLGLVMSFISHSAVKGFTSAAALIITATQLPHFLGMSVPKREYILPMILDLIRGLPDVHLPTLGVGVLTLAVIYGLRKYRSNLPGALIALLVTTIPLVLLELHEKGIAIVGASPGGLPGFHVPSVDFRTVSTLLGPALVLALVCFAETYSVGKTISAETKQKVDVDQEFIGQGLANVVGAFFQAYPAGGSFSRTAINYSTGAKTGISSVVAGLSSALALLFLTPLFTYIPRAALAAIVISAVLLLFHPREVLSLWKMNRHDGIVALCVFILALLTKPDYALLIGVVVSLIFFMWKTMHPRVVRVTKDPELNMFLNGDVHGKPSCPQILELRSDNSIFFGNAEYTVEQMLSRLHGQRTPVKFLLLDFEAIGFVDVSAIDELRTLLDELRMQGTRLALIYVRLPVRNVLESTGFLKEMGQDTLLGTRGEAISFLFQRLDHAYCRDLCPHKLFHECYTVK